MNSKIKQEKMVEVQKERQIQKYGAKFLDHCLNN
jgi:hypothetical protein